MPLCLVDKWHQNHGGTPKGLCDNDAMYCCFSTNTEDLLKDAINNRF